MELKKGKVYLIGAGPGDPELITLKGKRLLEEANCIVYDRLVNSEILSYISSEAEMIFVGKKPGAHSFSQDEINNILVQKSSEGKTIARLKGGDPFVFGRGGEECQILSDHNIPFEVVPGVTSAIAVPSYAGIPVTHREYNTSFTVITGHEDPTKGYSSLNWEKLASISETLIFLMGMSNLEEITSRLMEHGRPEDTPVALIRNGTTPSQKTFISDLKNVAQNAKDFSPPAVIVIGEVVKLREKINWFEKLPLFSKNILVTRARAQASNLSCLLKSFGAKVIEFPVIKIIPPENYEELDRAIEGINTYDWVIFTSQNGVKSFLERLYIKGKDVRAFGRAKLCAIGPQTARELKNFSLIADYVPPKFVAEELIKNFPEIEKDTRILIPRAKEAREIIPQELSLKGATIDLVTAYQTVREEEPSEEIKKIIKEGKLDLITFTSSSTVKNFIEIIEKLNIKKAVFDNTEIAAIGPITAKTAENYGFNVGISPSEYTIEGLVEEIVKYYMAKGEK